VSTPPHHQGFVQQGPADQHRYQAHAGAGPQGETPCQVLADLGPRARFRRLVQPYGGWRPLDPASGYSPALRPLRDQ
jgi:hypothetical protein